jgi:hypothetical protein
MYEKQHSNKTKEKMKQVWGKKGQKMAHKTYNSRHEYMTESMVDWLKDFADKQAEKVAKDNKIDPRELKNAGYMDNILDIVNRKKKISVEEKVAKYRELVGLDMIDSIEKEGGHEVIASRVILSCREKVATGDEQLIEKVRQYITDIIRNRNGSIATPAIIDQLEHYMKLDKEWLRKRENEILDYVKKAREQFQPQNYNEVQVDQLTRTDDPSKGEKEAPPFLPPASAPV